MYKIYGKNDTFLYQLEEKPKNMRNYEAYYLYKEEKIANDNYDEADAQLYIEDHLKEIKKQAPHEEKIDVTHENYDYVYARTNAEDGYGSIKNQLDMMYHSKWQDHIKGVKKKYPKK